MCDCMWFYQTTPEQFLSSFNAPIDKVWELLEAKTLSINKLLAICPPGTLDPTPHLYNNTMYTLTGMMAAAFITHSLVKPTDRSMPVIDTTAQDVSPKPTNDVVTPIDEKVGDRVVKKH